MKLHEDEIKNLIQELTCFYYQYQMLESILKKTEKEIEEHSTIKKQLNTYYVLLRDTLPYVTCTSLQKNIELYLQKLLRCI